METSTLGLIMFALASSITPGPNNLMLMTSGANFGVTRTLPHWAGVVLGFTLLLFVAGLGAGALILGNPAVALGFRIVCVAVIAWLSWKIAFAGRAQAGDPQAKPLTFVEAAAFQWINPKAWVMALGAVTLYAPGHEVADVAMVALVFGVTNLPCTAAWLVLGQSIQKVLAKDSQFRAFNVVMALLLFGSSLPMLFAG